MKKNSFDSKKILIAEDEQSLSDALKLKLSRAGYRVNTVDDGQKAIYELKTHKYNLFLCDLVMPGAHGFEVLEKMKELNIKTPVIILSNLNQQADIAKAESLGVQNYLIKADTSIDKVLKCVQDLLV